MTKVGRLALALAGAMAGAVPCAEAAWLRVGTPAIVAPGWTRIAGRYAGLEGDGEPVFRAVARCRGHEGDARVLDGVVQHLAPADGALWLDVPGTLGDLAPANAACAAPELAVEMVVGAAVVASAPVATADAIPSAALVDPPPAPLHPARKVSLKGERYGGLLGKRTEAGVEWALDSRVSLQLNYERTAQSPMMPFDHDDGILTRVRVGF